MKRIGALLLAIGLLVSAGCGQRKTGGDGAAAAGPAGQDTPTQEEIFLPDPENEDFSIADVWFPRGEAFSLELPYLGLEGPLRVQSCDAQYQAGKVILSFAAAKDGKEQGYFAVLDYGARKSYLTQVNVPPACLMTKYVSREDYELDGAVIVYRDEPDAPDTEIYRYSPSKDAYRRVYSNLGQRNSYFTGSLADDYMAVVECGALGYSRSFSMIDAGLQARDLEQGPPDRDDKADADFATREFRRYQDGKWTGKRFTDTRLLRPEFCSDPTAVFAGTVYLKFRYPFYIGEYFRLGYANLYFRYDAGTDKLVPGIASFEMEAF